MSAAVHPLPADDGDHEAQYHADLLVFERAAREALRASLTRPLTVDEAEAIAWWARLPPVRSTPPRAPQMRADGHPF